MKISVLVASLATQGISRVRILADLLSQHYEVEVFERLKSGEKWGCSIMVAGPQDLTPSGGVLFSAVPIRR